MNKDGHTFRAMYAWLAILLLDCGFLGPVADAALRLPHIFGDHMVLQRDKSVRIWGWAEPQDKIAVEFAGRTRTATAANDRTWLVTLPCLAASREGRELRISSTSSTESVTFSDFLVGEVWLCGGQSNMQMPLWLRPDGFDPEKADYPLIRLLSIPQTASRTPQEDFPSGVPGARGEVYGKWFVCQPGAASRTFSALGFFIGKRLHEKLGVP